MMKQRRSSVNRGTLVEIVQATVEMPRKEATAIVDAIIDAMAETLQEGQEVRLTGFGILSLKERQARRGRNPQTGEQIDIPAKIGVRFKPGRGLLASLNG
jgi:DNA-binding protein HU-beta